MTSEIERRLAELGLQLPPAAAPAANYLPYTISGRLLLVSGQLPYRDGKVAVTGRLGDGVSLEQGQEAARLCALNLLAQAKAACGGDLGRLGALPQARRLRQLARRVRRSSRRSSTAPPT